MARLEVVLVTPERELWSGEATMVIARGTEGEVGILAGHAPMMVQLAIGPLRVQADGEADVAAVVDGIGLDRRIGRAFMSPGPGFGGSCLPSQARALPGLAHEHGVRTQLMDAITRSNEDQADWFLDRLEMLAGGSLAGRRVALLGSTFKAGTDDLRESPALRLAIRLVARGSSLAIFDPIATDDAIAWLASEGTAADGRASAVEAATGADAVIVATEWPEFRVLDWEAMAAVMRGRIVGDARHAVDAAAASRAGFRVITMGVLATGAADLSEPVPGSPQAAPAR
jgi:UDPglucose 6-dehydrogenase